MTLIQKSIQYKSRKRQATMSFMILFVLISLYIMFSMMFAKGTTVKKIEKQQLAHTKIMINGYEEFDVPLASRVLEEKALSYNVQTKRTPVFEGVGVEVEMIDSTDHYIVLEGKPLELLENHEIAITVHDAKGYTGSSIGQSFTIENNPVVYSIQSVVDYPYFDLAYSPVAKLKDIDFFSELQNQRIFMNESSYHEARKLFNIERAQIALNEIDPSDTFYFDSFILAFYHETPDLNNQKQRDFFVDFFGENAIETYEMKFYYPKFSFELEDKILSEFALSTRYDGINNINENINYIQSMALIVRSSPIQALMQATISKFVVSGILISSFYGLYIHFENQLKSQQLMIAGYNLLGIGFNILWNAYFKWLTQCLVIATSVFVGLLAIVHVISPTFILSWQSLISTYVVMGLFAFVLLVLVKRKLKKIVSSSHDVFKTKGKSYKSLVPMSRRNLVLGLSAQRLTSKLSLTCGFALSLAISMSVCFLSISAVSSISNIYAPETMGFKYDYILSDFTFDQFEMLESNVAHISQVSKKSRVIFADYSFNIPVKDLTIGTTISVYDHVEPFVTLYKGSYPPLASIYKGAERGKITGLASKRLADTKQLNPNEAGYDVRAESKFLFYKENYMGYEDALRLYGMFPTLMDRGFTSVDYRELPREDQKDGMIDMYDAMVLLEDTMTPEAFESLLDSEGIRYVSQKIVIDSFQQLNQELNRSSLNTLWVVGGTMLLQTILTMAALMYQLKEDKEHEDTYLSRIGIHQSLLRKVNHINTSLRLVLACLMSLVFVWIVLPIFNQSLMNAFAITVLPVELYYELLIILGSGSCLLLVTTVVCSRYRLQRK